MTHSIIIITRDRAQEVSRLLHALMLQTQPPDEVVLVDAGVQSGTPSERMKKFSQKLPLRILHTDVGMALQRNVGLDAARGDVLTFLDDDAIPEAQYCAEILRVFRNDADDEIAAVGGTLLGQECRPRIERLFRRIFLLQTGAGRNQFRASGFPDFDVSRAPRHPVEILPSTALSFRRSAAEGLRFDAGYFSGAPLGIETGRCFGEDAWFVSRLSRKGRIALCATARYVHPASERTRERCEVTQALYVYAMRMLSAWRARGPFRSMLRLWALGGQGLLNVLQALHYRDLGYVRGYARAMYAPLRRFPPEGK
jgi:GT2 family glycosyltransferase